MRGLLALILALSSTVAVAAPRAAVSPLPKSPVYNKAAPNFKSGRCNLFDFENVSSQQITHSIFCLNFLFL